MGYCAIVSRIVRGGIVIKPWCIQGQPICFGYFELPGCSTIGQAWVTAIAVAISLTALFCLGECNAVITLILCDDDVNVEDSGGESQAGICFVLMNPGRFWSPVSEQSLTQTGCF